MCVYIYIYIYIYNMCVYTHIQRGGYQIIVDFFIMEYHFIFEQLQKENNAKIKNNCCHISNSVTRVCRVRSRCVHSKDRRSYTGRLHTSDNDHCRTNRNQNLHMTCNNIWLSTKLQNNVSMSTGFVLLLTWVQLVNSPIWTCST